MSKKKENQAKVIQQSKSHLKNMSDKSKYLILMAILAVVTVSLHINNIRNYYNLDEYHIAKNNPDFEQ